MNRGTQTTILYVIVGIIMGYASMLVNNNYIALVIAVAFLFLISEILKRILKINEKFKWFWSNGGWLYVFVWFVVWIIFYNL